MGSWQSKAIEIAALSGVEQVSVLRELFEEYERSIGISLCFQDFAAECDGLPGRYAPPKGGALIAWANEHPTPRALGCVVFYPLDEQRAEMKRLYVRPEARGLGLGRALVEHVMASVRTIGYRQLCLDTLERFSEANQLYSGFGFYAVEPYNANPHPDVRYYACDLC